MYRVDVDGHAIHDPRDSNFILPYAKVDLELNKTGEFEFDITEKNPGYQYVNPMRSVISVYDDGELIFRGRSTTKESDFYNTGTLKCEGELSYLIDTILRPRSSAFNNQTNRHIFQEVLIEHNSQVTEEKQFLPGMIDVDSETISQVSFNYEKPLDFINTNLIEKYGGYLRIRYADGKRYLDWVKQYGKTSKQPIRFGYNLLDLKKTLTSTDVCTVVVPVGGSEKKVTVKNAVVNGNTYGKDYIQNDEAVSYFGKIIKVQEFSDIQEPTKLYTEGKKWLEENMKSCLTVELTALDLHMVDLNIDDFKLGDLVPVISIPHEIVFNDELPVIEKYSYDLTDPSKNTITVGKTLKVFTERKDPVIYDKVQEVTGKFDGYVETTDGKIEEITNDIKEYKALVIHDFTAVNGRIENLSGDFSSFKTGEFEELKVKQAELESVAGDFASFKTGEFESLKSKQADFENATAQNFLVANAKIADLEAGQIKTEYLDAHYAKIDLANIKDGSITTAMIGTGVVGTAQIADGSITDAKIVGLTANKITAGTLDAGTIEVINLNAANITVGTINGQQIAPGAIDMGNLADSVTGEINTANTNANQAIQDALDAMNKATSAANAANAAQTTANGKNTVYYQSATPAGAKKNDIWFNTAKDNQMSIFDGSKWVLEQFGANAIEDGIISSDKIATDVNTKIQNAFDNAGIAIADSATANTNASNALTKATSVETRANNGEFDGKGIFSSATTYQSSTSGTTAPTGSWSASIPSVSAGSYLWTRTVVTYTDGTTSTSYSVGKMGNTGTAGSTGATGKGISNITNFYLASSSSSGVTTSSSGWSTTPQVITTTNRYHWQYQIITYTDNATMTTTPAIIGVYGDTGATGSKGETGATGAKGKGISSVTPQYYLSTSNTAQSGGSWSSSQPTWSSGKYYWTRDMIVWSDSTITYTTAILASGLNNANTTANTAKTTADTAKSTAYSALNTANAAKSAAGTAQSTADGKNTVFYQNSAPTTVSRKTNDIWFDTDDGNKMYYWNGSAWTERQFGTNAIANATITNALIADATIQSAKIANLDAAKITSGYLAAARIQAGSLTADKLVAKTITAESGVLADACISTANIADLAVTNGKIANLTIGTAKIADLAVTNAKLANLSVTSAKIADATIESAKIKNLDAGKITTGTLDAARIGANTITAGKIAANAISTDKLSANAVTAEKIASRTITSDKIVSGAITSNEIAAKTITANNIAANTITASSGVIANAAITNAMIANLDATKITTGTLSADRIDVNGIFAKNITATGTISGVNLVGATGSFSGSITATYGILGGYKISENKLFSEKIVSPKGGSVYVDCYDANGNQVDVQGKNVNVNERQKSSISIEPGIVTAEGWEKSYYYEVVGSNHYGYNEITYNKININNGINLFTKYVTGSLKNQTEINADPTTTSFNDCMNLFMDGGNIRLHSGSIVGGEFVENTVEPFVDITSSGIIIDPGNSNTAVQIENASYIDGIDTSGNFIHLIRAMNNTCAVGDSNFQTGIYGNSLSIKCTTTVSGNMKATNHIMNGNKTGYQDGKTGIYLNSDGYMHLQRASSSGDPYIGFLRDSSTSISSLTLRSNGKFRFNKALELDGTNIDAVGERGIYSTTMSNYIVRYYVTDSNVKCTALGNNSYATRIYGSSVWANKAVSTSDVRYKEDFHPLDAYEKMFMYLEPVTFKWKRDYEENDDRIHFGLKAQQVEEAFAKAGFDVTNYSIVEDYGMEKGLCYNDLLPTTIHMTQKNTKELMHQAGKIDLHETIIRDLQNRIYQLEKQLKELKQAVA